MEFTHDYDITCFYSVLKDVASNLYKNKYYKESDLDEATIKAKSIIKYGLDINIKTGKQTKEHEFFKNGNLKLEKNVLIWDMPAIITCKQACKNCYAVKPERCRKNTRVMRLYNYIIMEYALKNDNFKKWLLNTMYNEIIKKCKKIELLYAFRVHTSGDLYNNDYLNFILELANMCKNIKNLKFYTYTKQLTDEQINNINKNFSNVNIVKSFIKIGDRYYINYGNKEYIQKLSKLMNEHGMKHYICHYGQSSDQTCMGNCFACLHCEYVLFVEH